MSLIWTFTAARFSGVEAPPPPIIVFVPADWRFTTIVLVKGGD